MLVRCFFVVVVSVPGIKVPGNKRTLATALGLLHLGEGGLDRGRGDAHCPGRGDLAHCQGIRDGHSPEIDDNLRVGALGPGPVRGVGDHARGTMNGSGKGRDLERGADHAPETGYLLD